MDPTTKFWLAMLATPVFILAVTALGKAARWWWAVTVAKDSDVYGCRYDWQVLLATPITLMWLAATMGISSGGGLDWTFAPIYVVLSFFGPLTFVAGFIRLLGFGHTRLGRLLGFMPPTDERLSTKTSA